MTIISEQLHVNKGPGNANVQVWHKCVSVFFKSLLLVTAFILAGVFAATSALASTALASTNNVVSFTFDLHFPNCNGDTPGFCPDGPFMNM